MSVMVYTTGSHSPNFTMVQSLMTIVTLTPIPRKVHCPLCIEPPKQQNLTIERNFATPVTFSEGPLPSIMCPEAAQWVMEVLKVPMNLTNWVLVGFCSSNLAVQLHISLKSEISIVLGFLKAAVDELPKETVELTNGILREIDSLAPICWEFVLPQLDTGVPVDRTGMPYVPEDPYDKDCTDSLPDVDAKPKGTPKPKASKPKSKKGTASNSPGVDAGRSAEGNAYEKGSIALC